MRHDRTAIAVAAWVAVSLTAPFGAARAQSPTVDATLTTILSGRADPRDGRVYSVVPVYQSLSLVATDLDVGALTDARLVVRGWGQASFGDPRDNVGVADLDVGYIEGRLFKRHLQARLGRQLVSGGGSRLIQMDGLHLDVSIWRGLGVQAYGGAPVTPRFATSRGDAMAGARVYYRLGYDREIGASFIDILDRGYTARQDVGVDGRLGLPHHLSLGAYALWSLVELRLAEADAHIQWAPRGWFEGQIDYRRTAPDLFLPRTSIFSVFSQETRDEVGVSATLRPAANLLRIWADFHLLRNEAGLGERATLKATLKPDRAGDTLIGAELRLLHLPSSGYFEARAFGIRRLGPKLSLTLDADLYYLERALNGQNLSFTASASAVWDFTPRWRLVLVGIADTTPLVERRFEGLVKIVYNPTIHVRQVQP